MIVFFFSCEKNPIIEENYYSDITPFEMAGVVYWGVGATDNSAPLYTIYINGVVTQREPGEYTNVLFHGRLKSGITGEEFSADSAKLYDLTMQEQHDEIAAERKSQVGTGDRSERIRTYNFPQGRVSDHRINMTIYKLDSFLDGEINEIIDAINTSVQAENLKASNQ